MNHVPLVHCNSEIEISISYLFSLPVWVLLLKLQLVLSYVFELSYATENDP
jgi:hypothetical protein